MAQAPLIVGLIDRLAQQIIGALHKLFGFQYSKNEEFYHYSETIRTAATPAIGTILTGTIRITQEADFVATKIMCNARAEATGIIIGMSNANTGAAGDLPDAPFLLLISDGSSDRQLSNEAVDAALAFGTYGGLPSVLSRPRLFARNANVALQFTTLKLPAAAWDLRVVFAGWKIYDAKALDLTARRA